MSKLKPSLRKALEFIRTHPGTRNKAFPWGYCYHFETPETPDRRRAPFKVSTIEELIVLGLVKVIGDRVTAVPDQTHTS